METTTPKEEVFYAKYRIYDTDVEVTIKHAMLERERGVDPEIVREIAHFMELQHSFRVAGNSVSTITIGGRVFQNIPQ